MEKLDRNHPQSFTKYYDSIVDELRTRIVVMPAFIPFQEEPPEERYNYVGIWDTGANNTVISHRVVNDLNLVPIDMAKVSYVGFSSDRYVYLLNLVPCPKSFFLIRAV